MRRHRNKIAVGAAAALAVVGAGGAIAATQLSPKQESQAVVDDAAEQLGIDADKLTAALKQALKNRVDAAVEAGRLTQAQGNDLKQRIDAGEVPLVAIGSGSGPHMHHHHADLQAAASYLGITQAQLRTALGNGKTLAQLAKARDKSVDGLISAMVKAETAELDAAVKVGRLTDAQRDSIIAGLEDRITSLVNGERPRLGPPPAGPPRGEMTWAA